MKSKFTIGIPTYNRLALLQQSLACARAQLDGDCQVVVVDNGSSDGTAEWLAGQSVQFQRNPVNLGSPAAFRQCVEAAETEYFSWLQDDDLLHPDLLQRARTALEAYPQASVYISYAACSTTRCNLEDAFIMGPPLEMDFSASQRLRIVPGDALIPLSYFLSVGIPPVLVYRREFLLNALQHWKPQHSLFAERSVLNAMLRQGPAVVDAFVGGLFFRHPGQEWRRLQALPGVEADWLNMAGETEEHLRQLPSWKDQFTRLLPGFSRDRVHHWLELVPSHGAGLSEFQWLRRHLRERFPVPAPPPKGLKQQLRRLIPPLLWEAAAAWKRR